MKLPRHIVVPVCIFVYFCIMAYIGRDIITVHHNYLLYFGTVAIELVVLVALFFFLKKRDKLRRERLQDMERSRKEGSAK